MSDERTAPERVGPYRLLRALGSGGWGTVYEGEVLEARPFAPAGARVAVKLLHAERIAESVSAARFLREARLGQAVDHPAVVRTYDAGEAEHEGRRILYLVMELVEGRTLSGLMRELQVVPEALLRVLAQQAAEALAAVHDAGAVHRDLKPSNLLITPDHQVKLMDLGVAALIDEPERLTATGLFIGTLAYAAPEHLAGDRVGPAADLYSLGVILHEAATGARLFDSGSTRALVARHLHETPLKAGQLNPRVTPFFEELIARLLDKDPGSRFPSARDLAAVLAAGERSAWWIERELELRSSHARGQLRRIAVPRDTAFANRVSELRALLEALADARAGRGRVLLLEGEAGVGKSRLLDELLRRAQAEESSLELLYGSDSPGAQAATGAIARSLVDYFGEGHLEQRLAEHLGPMRAYAGALAALLRGLPGAAPGAPGLGAEALPALLQQVARAIAARGVTLWVVEDLHFASAEGRALFSALAERARELPLLLIGTTRPGGAEELGALLRLAHVSRLEVARLGEREVLDMLRDFGDEFGSEAGRELRRTIAMKSDGNPFFVTELMRALGDRAIDTRSLGGDAAPDRQRSTGGRRLPPLAIPSSVRELLLGRLRGLAEDDRVLLNVGATEGFSFDPERIAAVRGLGLLETLERLAALERRWGVLRATGAGFQFDHHLLQELIYESLPPALRRVYHRRLAEVQAAAGPGTAADALFVVSHTLRGGALPETARLEAALDHLAARYRTDDLLELVAGALALAPAEDARLRCDLRLREADARFLLHQPEAHRAATDEALAAAERLGDRGRGARALLARGLMGVDEGQEARPALEAALTEARAAGERRVEGRALGALGHIALREGDFRAARELYARQREIAAGAGDPEGEADAEYYEGEALLGLNEFEAARERLAATVERCRHHGFRRTEARATADLALASFFLGRYADARRLYQRALDLAAELGFREGEALSLANFALLALVEGSVDEAEQLNLAHLELAREIGSPFHDAYAHLYRGEILRSRGDTRGAERAFEVALDTLRGLSFQLGVLEAAFHLGRLLAEVGRLPEAIERLREAERVAQENGLGDPAPLPSLYLARLGAGPVDDLTVPETMQLPLRAEAHLVLHLAGAGAGEHLARALELLERQSRHLIGGARERFWRQNSVARAARAAQNARALQGGARRNGGGPG